MVKNRKKQEKRRAKKLAEEPTEGTGRKKSRCSKAEMEQKQLQTSQLSNVLLHQPDGEFLNNYELFPFAEFGLNLSGSDNKENALLMSTGQTTEA
jgi:hypothetical protein